MSAKPEILGVIPARGGSKGVPRKNLKPLAGKPLILHTVEAALKAKTLTSVLVTSDSDEILDTACVSSRVIRLKRPAELAQDDTPSMPVFRHAVLEFEKSAGRQIDYFVALEPPAPLRLPEDIDACVQKALSTNAEVVVSAKAAVENPYFGQVEPKASGSLWHAPVKRSSATRRQDVPPVFTLNGAVYVFTRAALFGLESLNDAQRLGVHEMPCERSVDLENELDFAIAELMIARGAAR